MASLEIWINPASPDHGDVEAQVRQNLDALRTVRYEVKRAAAPPGTLTPGWTDIVAFVVQHHDKLFDITIGILKILGLTLGQRAPRSGQQNAPKPKEQTPEHSSAILQVDGVALTLPATANSERRFVREIQKKLTSQRGTSEVIQHRRSGSAVQPSKSRKRVKRQHGSK